MDSDRDMWDCWCCGIAEARNHSETGFNVRFPVSAAFDCLGNTGGICLLIVFLYLHDSSQLKPSRRKGCEKILVIATTFLSNLRKSSSSFVCCFVHPSQIEIPCMDDSSQRHIRVTFAD